MNRYSHFGEKFSANSGIHELMEDLGGALASANDETIMMGGGNPAHIPEIETVWRERLREILDTPGGMEAMLGDYDTPRGRPEFLETLARFFKTTLGWDITAENIALTTGSQSANFLLFNLLTGSSDDGFKKILFPLVPEYIGYADQGIERDIFTAWKPDIEFLANHQFKYRIAFQEIGDDIAAICLSRPTNPSANVVTIDELRRLAELAEQRGIYLIIDNAYGRPFPAAIFRDTESLWNDRIIHTFSLSKIGLPGTRTGILIANREIIHRISVMNAALVLANGNIGAAITQPLFANGELHRLAETVMRPFYQSRSEQAQRWAYESFDPALDWHLHVCEGAFFFWLWMRNLPISDYAFYERLKARNVLVVPGRYFFPGFDEPWQHRHECIRITYCADPQKVRRGLAIIGEEMKRAYSQQ